MVREGQNVTLYVKRPCFEPRYRLALITEFILKINRKHRAKQKQTDVRKHLEIGCCLTHEDTGAYRKNRLWVSFDSKELPDSHWHRDLPGTKGDVDCACNSVIPHDTLT